MTPAPTTTTSASSGTAVSSQKRVSADPVPQHADAVHLELDDIARLEPPPVTVLEDAAGSYGAGAKDIARPQDGVAGGLSDELAPGEVHVAELSTRALLAVHA